MEPIKRKSTCKPHRKDFESDTVSNGRTAGKRRSGSLDLSVDSYERTNENEKKKEERERNVRGCPRSDKNERRRSTGNKEKRRHCLDRDETDYDTRSTENTKLEEIYSSTRSNDGSLMMNSSENLRKEMLKSCKRHNDSTSSKDRSKRGQSSDPCSCEFQLKKRFTERDSEDEQSNCSEEFLEEEIVKTATENRPYHCLEDERRPRRRSSALDETRPSSRHDSPRRLSLDSKRSSTDRDRKRDKDTYDKERSRRSSNDIRTYEKRRKEKPEPNSLEISIDSKENIVFLDKNRETEVKRKSSEKRKSIQQDADSTADVILSETRIDEKSRPIPQNERDINYKKSKKPAKECCGKAIVIEKDVNRRKSKQPGCKNKRSQTKGYHSDCVPNEKLGQPTLADKVAQASPGAFRLAEEISNRRSGKTQSSCRSSRSDSICKESKPQTSSRNSISDSVTKQPKALSHASLRLNSPRASKGEIKKQEDEFDIEKEILKKATKESKSIYLTTNSEGKIILASERTIFRDIRLRMFKDELEERFKGVDGSKECINKESKQVIKRRTDNDPEECSDKNSDNLSEKESSSMVDKLMKIASDEETCKMEVIKKIDVIDSTYTIGENGELILDTEKKYTQEEKLEKEKGQFKEGEAEAWRKMLADTGTDIEGVPPLDDPPKPPQKSPELTERPGKMYQKLNSPHGAADFWDSVQEKRCQSSAGGFCNQSAAKDLPSQEPETEQPKSMFERIMNKLATVFNFGTNKNVTRQTNNNTKTDVVTTDKGINVQQSDFSKRTCGTQKSNFTNQSEGKSIHRTVGVQRSRDSQRSNGTLKSRASERSSGSRRSKTSQRSSGTQRSNDSTRSNESRRMRRFNEQRDPKHGLKQRMRSDSGRAVRKASSGPKLPPKGILTKYEQPKPKWKQSLKNIADKIAKFFSGCIGGNNRGRQIPCKRSVPLKIQDSADIKDKTIEQAIPLRAKNEPETSRGTIVTDSGNVTSKRTVRVVTRYTEEIVEDNPACHNNIESSVVTRDSSTVTRDCSRASSPVTWDRTSVTRASSPVTRDGPPVTWDRTSVTRASSPVTRDGPPVTRDRTSVTRASSPVTRDGSPVTRDRTSVTRASSPVTRDGSPVTRDRTSVTRASSPVSGDGTPVSRRKGVSFDANAPPNYFGNVDSSLNKTDGFSKNTENSKTYFNEKQ